VTPSPEAAGREPAACAVGLDVGGSSLKAGLVLAGGGLAGEAREVPIASQGGEGAILDDFASALSPFLGAPGVRGIGIGMPGPFDYERGVSLMRGLTKFDGIYGLDLGRALRERLQLADDVRLRFVNDAAAFALGEVRFGAGRGCRRVMAVTLGTGCGSAFAVDGDVVTGGDGVPPHGYVYCLPYRGGIVDDHLSSRGLAALWREVTGSRGDAPDGRALADAARAGDSGAGATYREFGARTAEALGGVIESFRPEVLVLGGQISRGFDLFGPSLEAGLAGGSTVPLVRPAEHLTSSALLGAASLVL